MHATTYIRPPREKISKQSSISLTLKEIYVILGITRDTYVGAQDASVIVQVETSLISSV